jgi:alpha-glucosidase (family GH31 glycosyl hydrolase)
MGTGITVKFPAGSRWIYMYDETQSYDGGTMATLNISYDEFPVFFKEGSPLVSEIDFSSIQ